MGNAPMIDNQPAIEIRDLSVQFAGRRALQHVRLTVPARHITVVIGPSGSGKTTLLRAVNRLNECFPACRTTGTVRLRIEEKWVDAYGDDHPLRSLRRRAAMVLQSPNVLPMSIEKNFVIPLGAVLNCSHAEIKRRMKWALEEVQLYGEVEDRLRDAAPTLSGGQQQRLCLARALALEPSFLLLDEPTASLDFRAARKIEELLKRLKDRYTILAVSHSLGQTCRIADHVVVLRDGRVAQTFNQAQLRDTVVFQTLVEEVF